MTDEQVPSILDLQYRPLTSPLPGTFVSSTDLKIIGPQGQDPYDRQVDLHFKIDHQHYHNIKFDVDTNPFQITVQGFPVGYYRIHYTYLNRDNWSDWYDSGLFTVVGKPNITGPGQNSLVQLSVDITGNGAVSQATMVVREETSGTVYGSGSALPDGTWKVVVKNLPADTAISLVAAQIYNNVEINTSAPLKLNVRATPVVISPKAGDVVRKLRPEVSGTGSNGTTVTIFHVGGVGGSYGSGTVANGLWKFKLTQDLHEGDFLIHAHATFNEQSMGWANMVPIIVRPAPVITGPEAGTVQNQTFTISGTNGEPGATIKIIEEPNDVVGTGSALSSGNWSIAVTVPPGPVSLVATQSIGIEPPRSKAHGFKIRPPQLMGIIVAELSSKRLARLSPANAMSLGEGAQVLKIVANSSVYQTLDWGQELVEQVTVISAISGKPMADWAVTWRSPDFGAVTSVTDYYGVAKICFIPTTPEAGEVTATVGEEPHSVSVSLPYFLNHPREIQALSSSTPSAPIGTLVSATVTVGSAMTGEPLQGVEVMWDYPDRTLPATYTDDEGIAKVSFRLSGVRRGFLGAAVRGGYGGWDVKNIEFKLIATSFTSKGEV